MLVPRSVARGLAEPLRDRAYWDEIRLMSVLAFLSSLSSLPRYEVYNFALPHCLPGCYLPIDQKAMGPINHELNPLSATLKQNTLFLL